MVWGRVHGLYPRPGSHYLSLQTQASSHPTHTHPLQVPEKALGVLFPPLPEACLRPPACLYCPGIQFRLTFPKDLFLTAQA